MALPKSKLFAKYTVYRDCEVARYLRAQLLTQMAMVLQHTCGTASWMYRHGTSASYWAFRWDSYSLPFRVAEWLCISPCHFTSK